jgi:hypothetical protein
MCFVVQWFVTTGRERLKLLMIGVAFAFGSVAWYRQGWSGWSVTVKTAVAPPTFANVRDKQAKPPQSSGFR